MTALRKSLVRARTRDVAFLDRMPAGTVGDVNRYFAGTTILTELFDLTNNFPTYGLAAVIDATSRKVRPAAGADAATDLTGVLVKPYPLNAATAAGYFGQQLLTDATVPRTSGPADILKRGFILVKLYGATPAAKGGLVYVRVANAGAGQIVGGFEAVADGANTIVAPARFTGPADINGITEIAWNL